MNHKVTICGVDTGSLPKIGREETRRLLELSKAGDESVITKALNKSFAPEFIIRPSLQRRVFDLCGADDQW